MTKKKKIAVIVSAVVAVVLCVAIIMLVCCPTVYYGFIPIDEKKYADKKIGFDENGEYAADSQTYIYAFVVKQGAPFVMVCPGGGYGMVSLRSEGSEIAERINELGYNAFVLNYRVGKEAHYPNPQSDLAGALKYVLSHADDLGVAADDYAIVGFSAGGHLAASFGIKGVGYEQYGIPKPSALILAYPVISMYDPTHAGTRENLLGKENVDNVALCDLYSVDKNVDADYPDTYIWWCKDDLTVNPVNSRNMVKALDAAGVRNESKEYLTGSHGAGLGDISVMRGWLTNAVNFWQGK